jgi:hypothetical protein
VCEIVKHLLSRSHARDPYRLSELLGLAPAYFAYFVPTLAPALSTPAYAASALAALCSLCVDALALAL